MPAGRWTGVKSNPVTSNQLARSVRASGTVGGPDRGTSWSGADRASPTVGRANGDQLVSGWRPEDLEEERQHRRLGRTGRSIPGMATSWSI